MAKYNAKSIYSVLFILIDEFSESDQEFVFENLVTDKFLDDIKNNPESAYSILNNLVVNIENGKTDKLSKIFEPYKDKIYMLKNMLKDYGNF